MSRWICTRRRHPRYPASTLAPLIAEGGLSQSRPVRRDRSRRRPVPGDSRYCAQAKFLRCSRCFAGYKCCFRVVNSGIQMRLTLLVLLGFHPCVILWDGDILPAYGLSINLLATGTRRAFGKSLFNTGIPFYSSWDWRATAAGRGIEVAKQPRPTPDASAISRRKIPCRTAAWRLSATGQMSSLLALGAQYGWQLAGMMLLGAAPMRSGWPKCQYSLRHYRRTGVLLVALG